MGDLCEPRTRDPDAIVTDTLVLAVQGLVVAELVGTTPATKLTSARLPSMTPTGAAGQEITWVSQRLITGRTYLRMT